MIKSPELFVTHLFSSQPCEELGEGGFRQLRSMGVENFHLNFTLLFQGKFRLTIFGQF